MTHRASQKPIASRVFSLLLTLTAAPAASASTPLSVDDAVERALATPELAGAWHADERLALSEADAASTWANPTLGWEREALPADRSEAEDAFVVRQAIDLSGKRELLADAARQQAQAARHRGEAARRRVKAQATRHFYRVLLRQRRHDALAGWHARLRETLALVSRRQAAGDTASWDRLRLERELAGATADLALEDAEREAAWAELAGLFATPPATSGWPRVRGTLAPAATAGASQVTVSLPEFEALRAEQRSARAQARAAERAWVPQLELAAGYKTVADPEGRRHGYVAGIALSVPLFDRGDAAAKRSRALAAGSSARAELLRRGAEADTARLARRALALAQAAREFEAGVDATNARLVDTATAGYREGEVALLALLDAHRGALEDRLRGLALRMEARLALIALDELRGSPK